MKNSIHPAITIIILCLINNIVAMDTMEIDSEEQYSLLLRQIAQREDNTNESLEHDSNILLKAHNWGAQYEPYLLKDSYTNLIIKLSNRLQEDRFELFNGNRETVCNTYCQILDRYADIDSNKMRRQLSSETRKYAFTYITNIPTTAFPIQLLSLVKKRNSEKFEPMRDKMLTNLSSCLCLALSHPEKAAALEDKQFNINALVKTGLTDHNDESDCLDKIIRSENQNHSEFLEQEIITSLPAIFKKHVILTSTLKNLLQSPSLKIRDGTLSALLSCITSKKKDWEHKDVIDDIFEHEPYLTLQGEELYTSLLTSLQQSTDYAKHYGTQRLIKRLAQNIITPFFANVISSYFNVPQVDPDSHMIDKTLTYALDHKTLSLAQLSNMLFTAKETGFTGFIDPKTMHQLKTGILLNEDASVKVRAQLLDELLIENEVTDLIKKKVEELPYSPFKRYARALLIALDKTLHQTSYFAARAELLTLHKEYPDDFSAEPDVLRSYKRLECIIQEPVYYKEFHKEPKPNYIHLEVKQELGNIFFSESPHCFGYVGERNDGKYSYQLHAYNKKVGIPMWISPIMWNKKRAYTVGKDAVYCVTDTNNITVIDLATGDQLQEISSPDSQLSIEALHMCGPDILYAVHNKDITRINVKTGDFEIISLPKQAYGSILIGNRLIIPTEKELFIFEHDGTHKEIPHYSDNSIFGINAKTCVGTDEFIVYQKMSNDKERCITCLKTDAYNSLWEYPLNSEIEQIQISPSDGTIFVLTKHAVLAINPHADYEHRLLWQTKLIYNYGTEIDSIHLTQDGSALYGIKEGSGALFSFNIHTGQKDFLYEKMIKRHTGIVGDYDGKLYIQGISY